MGLKWVDLDSTLQSALLASVKQNAVHFNSQDTAMMLFAFDEMGVEISDLNGFESTLFETIARVCPKFTPRNNLDCVLALDHIGYFWKDFSETLQKQLLNSLKNSYVKLKSHERGMLILRLRRLAVPSHILESFDCT